MKNEIENSLKIELVNKQKETEFYFIHFLAQSDFCSPVLLNNKNN